MLTIRYLIIRCIAVLILILPVPAIATPFDGIYVLGDSLSDQGNILAATTALGLPLPDPLHYDSGRFSNGPVYADLLAQQLGLPLGPSLFGGTNFAFGGARTTYNIADSLAPPGLFPWSLNAETAAFAGRGIHDSNGLYIVFSGSNDLFDILSPIPGLGPASIPDLLTGIGGAIQAFKLAGAQTILVPNIPNLGLTPAVIGNPAASAIATNLALQYNALLHAQLAAITGVNIIEFNTFDWLTQAVSNPGAFGLSIVNTSCYSGFVFPDPTATECANPDDYLFWDRMHPTRFGQALLAEAMLQAIGVPEPASFALFLPVVVVLGAFTLRRRRQPPILPSPDQCTPKLSAPKR